MSAARKLDFALGIPLTRLLSWFAKAENGATPEIRRLLLIKLAAAGDTILLVPTLRALRKRFPATKIDWLVSGINEPLARTIPYVDHIIRWNGPSPVSLLPLASRLRSEKYDAVIDFEQWARGTAIVSYLSGAPIRIGFDTPGQHRARLFTRTAVKRFDQHETEEFFELASRLAPLDHQMDLELWENEAGKEEVKRLASVARREGDGPNVLLHPGCGSDGLPREWPLANYAVLAHWLIKEYKARLFITGGPEEIRKTASLRRLIHKQGKDLGGKLTWLGLVSLVRKMDLVISGNTGVMHMAAALQIPQVALHGPTNPTLWGPINPKATVLKTNCPECPSLRLGFEYHRRDSSCMARIDIDSVKRAVTGMMAKRDLIEGRPS